MISAVFRANNLYGWVMFQKLAVAGFKWVEDLSQFKEDFLHNYNENSNKGYFLEVDVEYPKNLFNLHNDLSFLSKREKIGECEKLTCNIREKKKNVQKAWLKPYIDMMNTKLRKAKNEFEKNFFKLINNALFGKTMENVRKHRDIKLVTTDRRRTQLVSEPNIIIRQNTFQRI